MDVRKWLIDARESNRLTQHQISDTALISRAHYANIENGVRNPSNKVAKRIASILGFEWMRFFEDDEDIQ